MEIKPISRNMGKPKIRKMYKIMFVIGILLGIVVSIYFIGVIK